MEDIVLQAGLLKRKIGMRFTNFTNFYYPKKKKSINQHQDKKVLEFIARIKLQTVKFEFGASRNELVRDRIVIGINNL
jgi:hypothetical protein